MTLKTSCCLEDKTYLQLRKKQSKNLHRSKLHLKIHEKEDGMCDDYLVFTYLLHSYCPITNEGAYAISGILLTLPNFHVLESKFLI